MNNDWEQEDLPEWASSFETTCNNCGVSFTSNYSKRHYALCGEQTNKEFEKQASVARLNNMLNLLK